MNRLSVIISVYNGAHHLRRCLPSLAPERADIHEVIIVDDGSDDETARVARGASVTVIQLPDHRGLCAARNAGAAHASGDILAFIDADTIVQPGWAKELRNVFATDASLVGGEVLKPDPRSLAERHRMLKLGHDERARNGFLPFVCGCNFAMRRDAFEQLHGFDERLPGAEDLDLSFRAQLDGHRVLFAPQAGVVHFPRASVRAYLRQQVMHARDRRIAETKYRGFAFLDMRRSHRRTSRALAAGLTRELMMGINGDLQRLALPPLDAAVHLTRRVGAAWADLEFLIGLRRLPSPIECRDLEQQSLASPLPERPSLLMLGDDRLAAGILRLALEPSPTLAVAPAGLEREAVKHWDEPAPWSLRLARAAVGAGWPVSVRMTALRLERERPRTWGEAFLALHRVHAWIQERTQFALLALGPSANAMAKYVPAAPIVTFGRYRGDSRRVVLHISRTDLRCRRGTILAALERLLDPA